MELAKAKELASHHAPTAMQTKKNNGGQFRIYFTLFSIDNNFSGQTKELLPTRA